jgi:tetratricopeptide (TPR) repeat protein
MKRLLLLIACIVCFTACAGAPASLREGSAGRWVRLQTEHFELSTDLAEAEARRAAEALEQTRAALLAAAWSKRIGSRATARASVVVLADGLDFERYVGPNYSGLFSDAPQPTIFLWGAPARWEKRQALGDETTSSVFRHELVHRLAAGIYGRQPRWFSEGLALFLESIVISEESGAAVFGRPNMAALRQYKAHRSVTVADALAWESDAGKDERTIAGLYGMSWILVHWLYNTQPEPFARYQDRLAKGIDPDKAWAEIFGSVKLDDIDKALFQYSRHGEFKEFPVQLERTHVEPVTKPLTQADVHAIRAQLAATGALVRRSDALKAEALQEVDRALAIEPANVLALKLHLGLRGGASAKEIVGRLRAQVRARADDGEAWLLLGDLLAREGGDAAEREAALRKALALLPGNPAAYKGLASLLASTGRGEEALPLATKATLLAPWDAAALDIHAASLFAVGRCPDALRVQTRAVDLIPERARRSNRVAEYTAKLREYQRACGEGAK